MTSKPTPAKADADIPWGDERDSPEWLAERLRRIENRIWLAKDETGEGSVRFDTFKIGGCMADIEDIAKALEAPASAPSDGLVNRLIAELEVQLSQDENALVNFVESLASDLGHEPSSDELETAASRNLGYIRADTRADFIKDLLPQIKTALEAPRAGAKADLRQQIEARIANLRRIKAEGIAEHRGAKEMTAQSALHSLEWVLSLLNTTSKQGVGKAGDEGSGQSPIPARVSHNLPSSPRPDHTTSKQGKEGT